MKKIVGLLGLCLAAVGMLMTANSCQKDDKNDEDSVNLLTINGKAEPFDEVYIYGPVDEPDDGIGFYPVSGEKVLLNIELAETLIGKKIDLSVLDVYSGQAGHWRHYVSLFSEEEEWLDLSWGNDDDDTVLAEKGSYLLVKKNGDNDYIIDLYCKSRGYELKFYYNGICRTYE